MKLNYIKIFSVLGFAFILACRQRSSFASSPNGKSLLWEISGHGLSKPSYFLGTMHLMCAEDAYLSKNVKSIIKKGGQIYLEVDMDNIGELVSGLATLNMKENKTLADVLPAEDYLKIRSFFEQYQPSVPFSVLEKQQPMMISSSLYELFLSCDQKNGIDLRIIDEAAKQKKETKGLESIAYQSAILDSIPYEAQAMELVKTVDSINKYREAMQEMMVVYKNQDIEKLHELTTKEEAGVNSYLDLLLYDRNRKWVEKFSAIAGKMPTLFAVGAGHLGGQKGVINLLKQRGYRVRALTN